MMLSYIFLKPNLFITWTSYAFIIYIQLKLEWYLNIMSSHHPRKKGPSVTVGPPYSSVALSFTSLTMAKIYNRWCVTIDLPIVMFCISKENRLRQLCGNWQDWNKRDLRLSSLMIVSYSHIKRFGYFKPVETLSNLK